MMKRTSVLFQVVLHLEIPAHLLTILQALGTMLIWKLQAFQQDPGYICLCLYIQDQLIYNFFIHTGRIDSFLNGTLFFPCSFTFDPFLSCSSVFFVKKRNKNNKNKTRNRKKRNKITKTKKKNPHTSSRYYSPFAVSNFLVLACTSIALVRIRNNYCSH